MRVVVVSAHYPPDFVSGGTLQPQRLARGLRDRGHDVRVYAGFLDLDGRSGRSPLEAWDDTDETGLPVRWITTTPYLGWFDRANFSNDGVERDFAAWMHDVAPDVVHLHSLQGLGGGLVRIADSAGARVVVTMHDFWWVCARQFLVDRTFLPCSLVVDAGVCACEVDRDWLADRNRHLLEDLRHADVVLAPSRSAAAVLRANGMHRVEVDENGMASPVINNPIEHTRAAAIRFVYAGGSEEMKGVHLLAEATARLGATGGWSLRAYGAGPYFARTLTTPERQVTLLEPFAPDELDEVMADADVLVIPSVMRESHSLLTREALARGVPVLTSDTLGPEEVVRDGVNGLVIPAGDSSALALAMSRLVEQPELVAGLRRGCHEHAVQLRSLAEQLDHLEAIYTATDSPATRANSIRRVVFMVGIEGAPLRYRAYLPAEALTLRGVHTSVHHYRDGSLEAAIDEADVVCVYRVPATTQVLGLIDRAHAQGTPIVFDVDDLIFDPDIAEEIPALRILPPDDAALWMQGVRRYRTTMEHCDAFIGSTDPLVRHVTDVVGLPAHRFDNGVGLLLARRSDEAVRRSRTPGPVRIAYLSGTTTHDEDWYFVEPAIERVLASRPNTELWLVGHLPAHRLERFAARIRRLPFTDWTALPGLLRDVDVNLAPLAPDSRFNEAKSAIKWLEAALCGTPTVASPTEPFRDAIDDGVNGVLATTVDDWFDRVDALVGDELLRRRMGARARRDALLRWSPHVQGERYLQILEAVTLLPDRVRSWSDVTLDEPMGCFALEPYADAPIAAAAERHPQRSLGDRTRNLIEARGPIGALRYVGGRVLRRAGLRR